VPPRSP